MTAFTDDDVAVAARAIAQSRGAARYARLVLEAVAPTIAARALREAADAADREFSKAYLVAPWLRARAQEETIREFSIPAPHYRQYVDGNHCKECADYVAGNEQVSTDE